MTGKTEGELKLSAADARQGRIPWRLRLRAWWGGYELAVPKLRAAPVTTEMPEHEVRAPERVLPWTDQRIGLVQALWGDGFDRPGDADDVLTLLKPCGLDPRMSVTELGCGLGGGIRTICREFSIWIRGLEGEAELAKVGQALSERAGLTKKAAVAHADLAELDMKPGGSDVIFAREAFVNLPDKTRLLHTVAAALKPRGQLLFTDYVLVDAAADAAADAEDEDPTLAAWRAGEPVPPAPWTVRDYTEALGELGLDIRISEDRTAQQIGAIKRGWAAFMEGRDAERRLQTYGPLAAEEADVWTRRLRALEAGRLQVYRFHAIKPGDQQVASW